MGEPLEQASLCRLCGIGRASRTGEPMPALRQRSRACAGFAALGEALKQASLKAGARSPTLEAVVLGSRMANQLLKIFASAAAEITDADLLSQFIASRDEAAFAELVRRHGPAVYRTCRRLTDPTSADDAFQATFLVLACRAERVRKAGSVGSWLIGVAGRVARQMRRVGGKQETLTDCQDEIADCSAPHPGSCLIIPELAAVLEDELTRLPDSLRAPLVLCLLQGRTQEQAATELGGSVRTLRRRLERAKVALLARRAGCACGLNGAELFLRLRLGSSRTSRLRLPRQSRLS